MSWPPSMSAKRELLIIFSWRARLSMVQLDYSHQKRNGGQQMFVLSVSFFIITSAKPRAIILHFCSGQSFFFFFPISRFRQTCSERNACAGVPISWLKDYLKCLFPIDSAAPASWRPLLSSEFKTNINIKINVIQISSDLHCHRDHLCFWFA